MQEVQTIKENSVVKAIESIDETEKILQQFGRVLRDEPMRRHTSFRTGGGASLLFSPSSEEAAAAAVTFLYENEYTYTVVGGCTNLLVGDGGIPGVVIKIADDIPEYLPAIEQRQDGLLYCGAGVKKKNFIRYALLHNLAGIEFMVGIPGCMGGGIIMNAGTNTGSFADILRRVRYISSSGEIKEQTLDTEKTTYRDMGLDEDCAIILGGYYMLPEADDVVALKQRIDLIYAEREEKHPIEYPSAGSVFKNPPGHSSWKLVNDAGLKGYTIGGAQVSEKHTNFIINRDNASSAEIRALVEYVRNTVAEKYGVSLHTEIRMIGEYR